MCFLDKMIKIKKSKKGAHIGIVLSIVMFIGFLVFLYVIISPAIKPQKDKQALLDSLEIRLFEQVSAEFTTVSISTSAETYDCLEINKANLDIGDNLNAFAKDYSGNAIYFNDGTDYTRIDLKDFSKIYYSEEAFASSVEGSCESSTSSYMVKSIKTNEKIFETKIIALISLYETDYEDVKELLKVPEGNDFSFNFTYNDKTNIGTVKQIPSVNVYAEEIPVQYVDTEANLEPGAITIKIW